MMKVQIVFRGKWLYLTACLIFLIHSSCLTTKSVEYRRIDHVQVSGALSPVITFDLVLANPNNLGVRVTQIQSDVWLEDRIVGKMTLPKSVRIKKKSEVSIPIHVSLSALELLSLLPSGLSMLSENKAISAAVSGDITLRKFFFTKKYPFQYSQKVFIK